MGKATAKKRKAAKDFPLKPPRNRAELKRVVENIFGLKIPAKPLCEHHDSPLDYLERSFFHQDDLIVWACRGGGKTMLAAVATLLDGLFRPGIKMRIIGGSFDQSLRLAEYIRELVRDNPHFIRGRMTKERIVLNSGSEIRILPQSQRAVRGQHVQKIRCDEVDLFDDGVWRALQFTTRTAGATRGAIEVLSTLHRPGGLMQQLIERAQRPEENAAADNTEPNRGYRLVRWCLWDVIERCDGERRCEDCPLAEDCRGAARRADGFFPIDDAITIKARSSRAAWEAEMLCRGAQREWLVFEEFKPGRHVGKVEYCPDWPLYRAIDFGYRNPLVCLWIQVTPAGIVHVLDEYVRARLPLARHAVEILKRDPGPVKMTYIDPAGRQRESTSGAACTEILAAAGISCAWRGSTIDEGLELIRCALAPAVGEPSITIHPRCVKLIGAFDSYHYPPPDSHKPADKPVKDGPDHLIDALRYFFVNRHRPTIATRRVRY